MGGICSSSKAANTVADDPKPKVNSGKKTIEPITEEKDAAKVETKTFEKIEITTE
jgi:hypothetical protein